MTTSSERAVDLRLDRWLLHVTGDESLVGDVVSVLAPPCTVVMPGPEAHWTVRVAQADGDELGADLEAAAADRPLLAFPGGGPCLTVCKVEGGVLRLSGRYRPDNSPALLEVDYNRRTTRVAVPVSGPGQRWTDWLARL